MIPRSATHWRNVLERTEKELIDLIDTPDVVVRTFDTLVDDTEVVQKRCCNNRENIEPLYIHAIEVRSKTTLTTAAPLVLVHGYVAASLSFYRNLVGLAHTFGTVYAVDWLGWGRSSRPNVTFDSTEETEAFFIDSLHAWRQEACGLGSIVLAGHSMGGYLAVAYAEQYPVDKLILMVPAGVQEQQRQVPSEKQPLSKRALGSLWEGGVQLETLFRIWPSKSIVNNVFGDYMTLEERRILTNYLHANLMLSTPPINRLFRVDSTAYQPLCRRIPKLVDLSSTCFIYAERDTWMKAEYGLAVAAQCSRIRVLQIQDAGHALMWKHPEAFGTAVQMAAGKEVDGDTSMLPKVLA